MVPGKSNSRYAAAMTTDGAAVTVNLRTDQLTKRFGDLVAVDGLSLDVLEGEVFALLGPNGAGKTTSIRMICGLLAPDSGQTFIYGQPVAGGHPDVRARVGVCPQQIVLWQRLTCIEQLQMMGQLYGVSGRVARRRGDVLLDEMGLTEKRDALARTLSGGMQRRLSIILALVHEPEIVVLDEPEAGLDPQSRVLVRDYIKALARDRSKTVILTTHNMDEADRASDRVAIMDHGKLLVLDTPEALKRDIGEGDTLEIRLDGEQSLPDERLTALRESYGDVQQLDGTLTFRARGIVDTMGSILTTLAGWSLRPADLGLRENTLEDVFISLTGRRLRQ